MKKMYKIKLHPTIRFRSNVKKLLQLIITVSAGFITSNSFAQNWPSIEIISSDISKIKVITIPGTTLLEAPPVVIKGRGFQYYCSSLFTRNWNTNISIADPRVSTMIFPNPLALGNGSGYLTHVPLNHSVVANIAIPRGTYQTNNTKEQWKRNYNGMFNGFKIDNTSEGNIILGINHCENKNEKIGSSYYQNTIRPYLIDQNNPVTFSGIKADGNYSDGWETYFAFLTATWAPNTQAGNWGGRIFNDLGPIAWPSQGYINECNEITSNGLRHPGSIMYNDSIYIFYLEANVYKGGPIEEGREYGVKVIRVYKNDVLEPSKYQVYYNGDWGPSLPEGFTADSMKNFVAVKGPKSTRILPRSERFSVAKIKNSEYFLGVDWYYNFASTITTNVTLRLSKDLVNWSDRLVTLFTYQLSEDPRFAYPVLLNKEGDNHSEIDLNDFYIIGVPTYNSVSEIDRLRLSLKLSNLATGIFNNDISGTFSVENPVNAEQFKVITDAKDPVFRMFSINGSEIPIRSIQHSGNQYVIKMDFTVSNGIYQLTQIDSDQKIATKKLVILK